MKNSRKVITHHDRAEGPIAADAARVSITRMAQTVNRVTSNRPMTRLKRGRGVAETASDMAVDLRQESRRSRLGEGMVLEKLCDAPGMPMRARGRPRLQARGDEGGENGLLRVQPVLGL